MILMFLQTIFMQVFYGLEITKQLITIMNDK